MNPRIAAVINDCATEYGVSVEALLSPARRRDIAHPRFDVMWRLWNLRRLDGTKVLSLPMIGKILNRDHTTVLYGVRRWQELHPFTEIDDLYWERKDAVGRLQRLLEFADIITARIAEIDRRLAVGDQQLSQIQPRGVELACAQ